MTPTDLRALAARVLAEEPSDELGDAVQDAIGTARWTFDDNGRGYRRHTPNPLTDLNASAAAMPAGWMIISITQDKAGFHVAIQRPWQPTVSRASAPTEPLARTAAALMARAAELEQKEVEV